MATEIKLTLADRSETVINTYQKYFYYDKNVEIKKKDVRELEGYDCLIIPSNSGFSAQHLTGFVRDLMKYKIVESHLFCFICVQGLPQFSTTYNNNSLALLHFAALLF
jgi:hypothetical protein